MPAQPLDELRPPDDHARLRPAEQLVPGEAHEVGPRLEALPHGRLVGDLGHHARAGVLDDRKAVPPPHRDHLAQPRALCEPHDPEVRLVNAQQQRRLRPDRPLVVRGARPVRRPHLDEPCARPLQHLGDPEPVADLDQLAAGDDDLAFLGQGRQRQQDRRRVVVHDQRGLRARQPPQQPCDVILPRSPPADRRSYSRFEYPRPISRTRSRAAR